MQKIFTYLKAHKIISTILVVVIAGGGYYGYQKIKPAAPSRYVLAQVEKGSVSTTVSGTGQIVSSNQFDIKAKVSGDVKKILVTEGQKVTATTTIMQLDTTEAYKTIRDAQASVASAKNSFDKLKKPATAYELAQAENALSDAKTAYEKLKLSQEISLQNNQDSIKNANDNINKAYDDSYNAISQTFLDLPDIISKLYDNMYSNAISSAEPSVGGGQSNVSSMLLTTTSFDKDFVSGLQDQAEKDYQKARTNYDKVFNHYKSVDRNASAGDKEILLNETLDMIKVVSQAAKSESNYFNGWADKRSIHVLPVFNTVKQYQSNIDSYISLINGHISSLSSVQQSLTTNRQSLVTINSQTKQLLQNNPLDLQSSQNNIKEKEMNLQKIKDGADPLDIQSQQISLQERYNSLRDAQEKLQDYTIKSPIDGVLSKINFKVNDTVGSGSAVATIVAQQNVAQITLNEVDVAKVKIGQKATLTFDALTDISLTGKVIEIDTVGTASQGVVSYTVKIALDTQNENIKVGMSVNVTIVTDIHMDVLVMPSAAIKTSGQQSYLEVPDASETIDSTAAESSTGILLSKGISKKVVKIGLTDDTNSEISGDDVKEGDWVIIKTIESSASSKTSTTSSQKSLFNLGGGGTKTSSSGTSSKTTSQPQGMPPQ